MNKTTEVKEEELKEVKLFCDCEIPVPSLTVDGIWCCLDCGKICETSFKK